MKSPIYPFQYDNKISELEESILENISRVLHSNKLILGPETSKFEMMFRDYSRNAECIATSSGTTALQLALLTLGIGAGDEVITVANTCAPTISAICLCGAVPVFCDVDESTLMMDTSLIAGLITPKTKAILPVHLWGMCVDMTALTKIAQEHDLLVIEDCAQSHGTKHNDKLVGTFGDAACFSFYPTKNIGAFGDAGAVVTNNAELADRLRANRMYGYDDSAISQSLGMNARINEIQASILQLVLKKYIEHDFDQRISIADEYNRGIKNPKVATPVIPAGCSPSYHQYVVNCNDRDKLMAYLKDKDIHCGIHYQTPIHKMPAFSKYSTAPLPVTEEGCKNIISIPIHTDMTGHDVEKVIQEINNF